MKAILTFLITSVSFYKSGLCKCPIIKNDETCDGEKVKIALSTKSDSTQRFVYNDFGNLWHLNYDPWAENKIIIHAHDKLINDSSYLNLIEDFVSLEVESFNIFSVDYSYFFLEPCEMNAAEQASYIGKCVAQLVSHLRDIDFPVYPQFHAVGDTFGATVLHYSAKHLKEESFERITGFNPSYGSLRHGNSEYLEINDAQFVDVWISSTVYNDTLNSTGHVKLFLSDSCGGVYTVTSCTVVAKETCFDASATCTVVPHTRCTNKYKQFRIKARPSTNDPESSTKTYLENYVESINSGRGFFGYKCNSFQEAIDKNCSTSQSYIITGENVHKDLRGLFWVDTSKTTTYFIGNMGELIPFSLSNTSKEKPIPSSSHTRFPL